MPTIGPLPSRDIDCVALSDGPPTWPVGNMTAARIGLEYNGTRNQAVFTIKGSTDGRNFYGLDTTVTISSAGITRLLDVTGYSHIRAELTTLETTTTDLRAHLTLFAQADGS